MKTLGLLGGMSWESTLTYYRLLNQHTRLLKGDLHSCPCIIYSFDFALIASLQSANKWAEAAHLLDTAAVSLQHAGADAIVLCTNTMHFVSSGIEEASGLPLLHIADPTAEQIVAAGYKTVGLLGTRFTMEKEFYILRLERKFDLSVIVPDEVGREAVHNIIYSELCNGIIREESRDIYYGIIEELKMRGAECLVLGCTEIGLLIGDGDGDEDGKRRCGLRVFDTTAIHAVAAVEWAMEDDE